MAVGPASVLPASVPPITCAVPGSFAWGVMHERHPTLIEQVAHAHPYPVEQSRALDALRGEILTGTIRPLPQPAPDRDVWIEWAGDYLGQPWGAPPFLWSESYFYRRLLDAVGFFTPGAWYGVDPFEPTKAAQLRGPAFQSDLDALDALPDLPPADRARAVLLGALWGNEADLGFRITATRNTPNQNTATVPSGQKLVHDDSAAVLAHLSGRRFDRICVVADNAGTELLADLVLVDHLLHSGVAAAVHLHVKPRPYYVSDTVTADLVACLRRMTDGGGYGNVVAERIGHAIRSDRLVLRTHPFYCQPWPYHHLPTDLAGELAAADLVIAKGDLNYRRLVGDLWWPATTSFADATAYFPAPVVALRILKSDVVVGLTATTVAELDAADTAWRTNGDYALIQATPGITHG